MSKYNLCILLLKLKYTFVIKIKGNKMKIKAFLSSGRFRIINVLLWNLSDEENKKIGQVALFRNWTNL